MNWIEAHTLPAVSRGARAGALALFLAVLAAGCASIRGVIPEPVPARGTGRFTAGASRVDITPLPGYPTGGHSIAGTTARGWWTRLYARAVYLEDARGECVVLVSCDVWSIPGALGDRVAELLQDAPDCRHIGRDRLLLAATHTHHGPGNFSSWSMYNEFAQRWRGFDPDLFEFLARRVALAVMEARRRSEPAELHWNRTRMERLARNRSLVPFLADPESRGILDENADLPVGPATAEYPDTTCYRAVDPAVSLLRVAPAGRPEEVIAAAAFLAVHPTSMRAPAEFYQGDFFGVAALLTEQHLARGRGGRQPVVALFNGAEGDVSPDWERQDLADVLRLGRHLHEGMVSLLRGGERVDGPIAVRFDRCRIADLSFLDVQGTRRRTSDYPLVGSASMGGAEDGRTLFHALGWQEGVTGPRRAWHGAKQGALDPRFLPYELPIEISRLFLTAGDAPREAPIAVARVGDLGIATLPGEFTVVMGRRIRDALSTTLGTPAGRIALMGLTGEYISYFTTPEEYEFQHYEGASTLYGPASGPAVQHHLTRLAARLGREAGRAPSGRYRYRPGPVHRFSPREVGDPPYFAGLGLDEALIDTLTGHPRPGFPVFVWREPSIAMGDVVAPRSRVLPEVAIEVRAPGGAWMPLTVDGVPETDRGLGFVTVAVEAGWDETTWSTTWMPPRAVDPDREVRFRVTGSRGRKVSIPFRPGEVRPDHRPVPIDFGAALSSPGVDASSR